MQRCSRYKYKQFGINGDGNRFFITNQFTKSGRPEPIIPWGFDKVVSAQKFIDKFLINKFMGCGYKKGKGGGKKK